MQYILNSVFQARVQRAVRLGWRASVSNGGLDSRISSVILGLAANSLVFAEEARRQTRTLAARSGKKRQLASDQLGARNVVMVICAGNISRLRKRRNCVGDAAMERCV